MAIDTSFFRSESAQRVIAESEAKGLAKGRAEDLFLLIESRRITLDDASRTRISESRDPELLREWFRRALTATTAEEIFGEEPLDG
ncbi:hypothetical protein [Actinacidiphila sp. bgisy145]|uniref:hypothetical protein n=1 Tax=Actinacidiphila sp. bgisy145 TaxID=3413792 RepID=UPI003EB8692F